MQPRKLRVCFAGFPYGGVGAAASEHPDLRAWFVRTAMTISKDSRVEDLIFRDFNDTPITMTRNRAVEFAQQNKADVLVMFDSDMKPDKYAGKLPEAKPFWDSSFDCLYKHYEKGPVCIGAPYCGPEPDDLNPDGKSCVYVFEWTRSYSTQDINAPGLRLSMYERNEAARMAGIAPVDALPTGLIMWDMRLFDIFPQPYFDYEWKGDGPKCECCGQPKPGPRSQKASTEDVVHTRDMSLIGCKKLGYNPILCNWDAWAGHWKPKCVGKPLIPTASDVSQRLCDAYREGHVAGETIQYVNIEPPVMPEGVQCG